MRRRIIPAAAVAAALAITALTGCSAPADPRDLCATPLGPGALSNGVSVGSDGAIEITGSTDILNAQRTVLHSGDTSELSVPGGIAVIDLSVYDAVTGEQLQERENAPFVILQEALIPEAEAALSGLDSMSVPLQYLLAVSLLCSAPGDTLVLASTAQQSMASQLSYNPTVSVLDVREIFPARAEGRGQGLPNGFPAVAVDETGRPGVVLAPREAPSDIRSAANIVGTGEDIAPEHNVIGNVLTVGQDGSVATNTWDSGMVLFGTQETPNPEFSFREQLTGYPLGSQVVILDPNDGAPLVHVVDVVAAV